MIWFIILTLISDLKCMSGDAAAAEIFSVRQEPEVIEVEPGGNVTMKCHYQGNFTARHVRVSWKSNKSTITTDRINLTGIQNGSFCLNLPSVRRNQSGTYVCEVIIEIPKISRMNGNGTVLIVTADSAAVSGTRRDIFFIALWTALSTAALTVGTGLLICCKYKRIKAASGTGDRQVSDALESEVQYATLDVRLQPPRPDGGGTGQNLGIEKKPDSPRSPRNKGSTEAVYSAIRR